MSEHRIMYVCSDCADGNPEGCGHYDRNDLRVLPDDRWLCEACFDDTDQAERGNPEDEDNLVFWGSLPAPPEYAANTSGNHKVDQALTDMSNSSGIREGK